MASHVVFFLLVWTGSLFSESVTWVTDHGFRTWFGKNGKTLYAAFISMDKEGAAKELRYGKGEFIGLKSVAEELEIFLKKEYGDVAAFRVMNTESGYGMSFTGTGGLKAASELLGSSRIAIMVMHVKNARGREFSEAGLAESLDAEGNLALHINGKRLSGKVTPAGGANDRDAGYGIVFSNPAELPDYCQEDSPVFTIWDDNFGTGIVFLQAFRYEEKGKPAPLLETDEFRLWTVIRK